MKKSFIAIALLFSFGLLAQTPLFDGHPIKQDADGKLYVQYYNYQYLPQKNDSVYYVIHKTYYESKFRIEKNLYDSITQEPVMRLSKSDSLSELLKDCQNTNRLNTLYSRYYIKAYKDSLEFYKSALIGWKEKYARLEKVQQKK